MMPAAICEDSAGICGQEHVKRARTIADLAGAQSTQPSHVAEAIQYWPRRMEYLAPPVGRGRTWWERSRLSAHV